jgi:hypothetical protein
MGLFSTIASAVSENATASSSSLSLPTVVQLHTNQTAPFRLDPTAHMPGYAVLTYQAAQVSSSLEDTPSTSDLRSKKAVATVPDLGVWNCCVTGRQSGTAPLVDSLLKIPSHEQKQKELDTFCFTIDLSDLQKVEPSISLLQEALVRFLIDRPRKTPTTTGDIPVPSATRTTSLYDLRSVQFGLAPEDESATATTATTATTAAPDENDRKISIALMIAAVLPVNVTSSTTASDTSDYHDKQAQALVVYHLRRYAAALNTSLCFVKDKDYHKYNAPAATTTATAADDAAQDDAATEAIEDQGHQSTLSIMELASVWTELAHGKAVWSTETSSSGEHNTATVEEVSTEGDDVQVVDDKETTHPTIYGPDHHHEDLIESVLLRNASYPGHWDAAKDSIWKVLPAQDSSAGSANKSAATADKENDGDEHWLSELRESVTTAETMKTPPPKKASKDAAASAQKTPKEEDVSNFFESLLN